VTLPRPLRERVFAWAVAGTSTTGLGLAVQQAIWPPALAMAQVQIEALAVRQSEQALRLIDVRQDIEACRRSVLDYLMRRSQDGQPQPAWAIAMAEELGGAQ